MYYNTPQYADFKNKYPQKYTEVQNVLLHEGLEGLDRYTIKVLTSSEYDTAHIGQNNVVSAGNKLLVLPSSLDGVALSRVDGELLAAILEHEMTHDAEDHTLKKLLVAATTPFAMHAAAKGIYNNIVSTAPKPGSYPTMTRSLLRIPRACAILNMAPFVQSWYTRRCEREADAGVGSSPRLALKLAEYFKKTHLPHEIIENADENTSALRKQLNKMLDTHPLSSERIAYLERWAAEAEEKKNKNKLVKRFIKKPFV